MTNEAKRLCRFSLFHHQFLSVRLHSAQLLVNSRPKRNLQVTFPSFSSVRSHPLSLTLFLLFILLLSMYAFPNMIVFILSKWEIELERDRKKAIESDRKREFENYAYYIQCILYTLSIVMPFVYLQLVLFTFGN